MDSDVTCMLKIILIGDSSVGKTNLLTRFVKNEFNQQSKPTIGVDFFSKTVQVDKKSIKAQIWDTAGQERFKSFSSAYYNGSHGAIIVYDITNKDSFENVKSWVQELKTHLEFEKLVVMLIGNKSDLEDKRAVTEEQGRNLSESIEAFFMETSAFKNGAGEVGKAFMVVIEEILNKNPDMTSKSTKGGEKVTGGGTKVDTTDGKKKGGCC